MNMVADKGLSDPTLSFGLTGISDWSTQMPFLDLMKTSRSWIGHEPGKWGGMTTDELAAGGYLDADGWPVGIPPSLGSIGTVWDWGGSASDPAAAASRAGVYVLSYEGEGSLQIGGDVKILSSSPGRMVVQNLTGGTMVLNLSATDPKGTGDYIRDISLVRQEYEALHEAGQIFNPDWLAVVQDARELRFMDWMEVNGVTSASWEDRPQVSDVSWSSGAPVEVMVALANQTGTEPWFTMPAGADEAYIRNFATYVRDHLDPGLEVHVEYSNEMWNWAFGQTQWLGAQAKAVWGSDDGAAWLDYAAMLATKSALIWDDVFGAEADVRVDNVLGAQTANAWIAERLLTAPLWQAIDPSGYVAPGSVFDSLAIATYFGGEIISDAGLRGEFLAMLKTPGADATAWLAAKMMDHSIPQVVGWWAANKAVADQYGLDLVAYEGGQHVLHSFAVEGLTEVDLATLTEFLTGFVRSQEMAELYHELWTAWAAVSDGPFMQFGDVDAASKWGAWGLFSALGDNNPRADLLMDLNAHTESWFGSGGGVQYEQGVILVAGDAAETLRGSDNDDFLIGGAGDDRIVSGKGHDAIAGEEGRDTLVLSGAPSDYTLVAEGSGYRLTAGGLSHYLRGIELFEFDGQVKITLAAMVDIAAGTGKPLVATQGDDVLIASRGADFVDGRAGDDSIFGRSGDDTLLGDTGNDLLYGGLGTDVLTGGSGADTLCGGTGADQMTGGFGADSFVVDSAADRVFELRGQGKDTVHSTVNWTLGLWVEALTLLGDTAIDGFGNALGNELTGNSAANLLDGRKGDDILDGGAGADQLSGGRGADQFVFNTTSGLDTITDFDRSEGDVLRFDEELTGTFVYRGAAGFTGGSDNTEARVQDGRVQVDLDGNGTADISVILTGLVDAGQLSAGDFVFM